MAKATPRTHKRAAATARRGAQPPTPASAPPKVENGSPPFTEPPHVHLPLSKPPPRSEERVNPADIKFFKLGEAFPGDAELQEKEVTSFISLMARRLPNIPAKNIQSTIRGNDMSKTWVAYVGNPRDLSVYGLPQIAALVTTVLHSGADVMEVKYFAVEAVGAGLGSIMIDYVKKQALKHKAFHVVLSASNEATGFFFKHGFTGHINGLQPSQKAQTCEDFSGSTFMSMDLTEQHSFMPDHPCRTELLEAAKLWSVGEEFELRLVGKGKEKRRTAILESKSESGMLYVRIKNWAQDYAYRVPATSSRLVHPKGRPAAKKLPLSRKRGFEEDLFDITPTGPSVKRQRSDTEDSGPLGNARSPLVSYPARAAASAGAGQRAGGTAASGQQRQQSKQRQTSKQGQRKQQLAASNARSGDMKDGDSYRTKSSSPTGDTLTSPLQVVAFQQPGGVSNRHYTEVQEDRASDIQGPSHIVVL